MNFKKEYHYLDGDFEKSFQKIDFENYNQDEYDSFNDKTDFLENIIDGFLKGFFKSQPSAFGSEFKFKNDVWFNLETYRSISFDKKSNLRKFYVGFDFECKKMKKTIARKPLDFIIYDNEVKNKTAEEVRIVFIKKMYKILEKLKQTEILYV